MHTVAEECNIDTPTIVNLSSWHSMHTVAEECNIDTPTIVNLSSWHSVHTVVEECNIDTPTIVNLSSWHSMHTVAEESGTHWSLRGGSGGITNPWGVPAAPWREEDDPCLVRLRGVPGRLPATSRDGLPTSN